MRFLAAALLCVALCAYALLRVDQQHARVGDPRRMSRRAACGAFIVLVLSFLMAVAVQARPSSGAAVTPFNGDRYGSEVHMSTDVLNAIRSKTGAKSRHRNHREIASGRPAAWCGWWLGQHLGMPLRRLWLAINWASVGSNAGGPGIGVIVVWRHHVGIITGQRGSQWIVKSGNDGGAVRERARSVANAIAYRTRS
jgi:hypothetical protein